MGGFGGRWRSGTLRQKVLMRRLFSSFARGWPGIGLLLLRIVSGGFLIMDGVERCRAGQPIGWLLAGLLTIADGALLAVGLWTPVAGPFVIVLSTWAILVQHKDPHRLDQFTTRCAGRPPMVISSPG